MGPNRPMRRRCPISPGAPLLALVLSGALGGCSNGMSSLTQPISIGALPAADSITAEDAPTAVYALLAQKALACWMGQNGPLKATHIFHADAASHTSGGKAEIALHERDLTQAHPWGARAFRIELLPAGGGAYTTVTTQNLKLPTDLANALKTDVVVWAGGKDGCQAQVVRPPPKPEPPPAPTKAKTKPRKP
jgi:hypothetical protein